MGKKNIILEGQALLHSVPGRSRPILQISDLSLEAGKTTFILGPNGAGKTSLIHMLSGLLAPVSGVIRFRSEEVLPVRHQLLPGFGFASLVSQEPKWNPFFRVEEELNRVVRSYPEPIRKEKIRFLLTNCQLKHLKDARLGDLSGGEQKRIAIGCALVLDRPLLFLDEPFSNLDENNRNWLREIISMEKARGERTMVVVHHQARDLEFLADEVWMMGEGKIRERLSPGTSPRYLASARLLGWRNIFTEPLPSPFHGLFPFQPKAWSVPPWAISPDPQKGLFLGEFRPIRFWMEEGRFWTLLQSMEGLTLYHCGHSRLPDLPQIRLFAEKGSMVGLR